MKYAYANTCCGMSVRCEALPEKEAKSAGASDVHAGVCPGCKSTVVIATTRNGAGVIVPGNIAMVKP